MSMFVIYAISRFTIRCRACRLRNLDLFRLNVVTVINIHQMNQLTYDNLNPGDDSTVQYLYCKSQSPEQGDSCQCLLRLSKVNRDAISSCASLE